MGFRFFSKKMSEKGKIATVETPGQLTAALHRLHTYPQLNADKYVAAVPVQEGIHPENVKHILTLDDAVQHMVLARPDVLTSDFEDSFLGSAKHVATLPEKPVAKPPFILLRFWNYLVSRFMRRK